MEQNKVTAMQAKLDKAEANLHALQAQEAATEGAKHWTEKDPATVSGIRRKPNPRADARRYAKYDREAAVSLAVVAAEREVERLTAAIKRAKLTAPVPFTKDELKAARLVRDNLSWHNVVRVNAKSVSVETPWSWTDRIALDRILEVR